MERQEYEVYIGYLDGKEDKIAQGEPLLLEVRDLQTFERKVVRATVVPPPATSTAGDRLWVMNWVEKREPEPWTIFVLEELDEDVLAQRSDISSEDLSAPSEESRKYGVSGYRSEGLAASFGQEEVRKYFEIISGKKKRPSS